MVLVSALKNPYQEAKQRFGSTTPAEQSLICLNRIEILEEKLKLQSVTLTKIMDVLLEEPKVEVKAKKKANAKVS